MDRRRYVVLRAPLRSSGRDGLYSRSSRSEPESTAVDLTVELPELTNAEADAEQAAPDVLSAAPVVDCALHAPIGGQFAELISGDLPWGIHAVGADVCPFDGCGTTVAVVDTGIDRNHEAFVGTRVNILEQDFTGEGMGDDNGHGTHCAATIFGGSVGGVRVGVAPGIRRALIAKVLNREGRGSTDQIIQGVNWALQNGANIISMSLGMDFTATVEKFRATGIPPRAATSMGLESYRLNLGLFESLATFIRKRGELHQPTILVVATGNESNRPQLVIAAAPPATGDSVLSVGALGQALSGLELAPFSNSRARLCGPGVDVMSARAKGGLCSMSGTSMATPHVAGVAALWADKLLRMQGGFDAMALTGKLIGSCTTKAFAPGFTWIDGGGGLVQAPSS